MSFFYRIDQTEDTIAAIATPPGDGGVAIIRISGKQAFSVIESLVKKQLKDLTSHRVHYLKLYDLEQKVLDEVLLLPMKAPKTFTGEDTIEIHCHGGSLLTQTILKTVCSAGARPALPGEFTFKAFQNGKIDLTKAEAIQSLIHSQNSFALNQASKQLEGALYKKISSIQNQLFDLAAILEAWIDFPEEGLDFCSEETYLSSLQNLLQEMQQLSRTFHEGKKLSSSLSLCLLGAPNVGKSSLLNALCGKERAIVTPIPGTTRDVLEEDLFIGPYSFKLHDTAGIRDTEEIIETYGIEKAKRVAQEADLNLFIFDAQTLPAKETLALLKNTPLSKRLVIINKRDLTRISHKNLSSGLEEFSPLWISAKYQEGIDELKQAIIQRIEKTDLSAQSEIILTNARHFHALEKAIQSLEAVLKAFEQNRSPELVLMDMREAMRELASIIGVDITEELLTHIFSKFCVGK